MLRRQLPAYSPLVLSKMLRALMAPGADSLAALRTRLEERYDASRAVLTGSGTDALTLALRHAVPQGETPRVALPAYGCFDLATAAVGADASVLLYDLDPATLGPAWPSLEEVCAAEPDVVVIAPLYGLPVDWDRVEAVVRPSDALLVEDAAQGFGAFWRGRPLGSLGDVSILSFGRGKGWTGGHGGALLERRARHEAPEPVEVGRRAVPGLTAKLVAQWALGRPGAYWLPAALPGLSLGETVYHPPEPVEAMAALAAALVMAHEEAAHRQADVRRRRAAQYREWLAGATAGAAVEAPRLEGEGTPGYLRFPILVPGNRLDAATLSTGALLGVAPGYPTPLWDLDAVQARALRSGETPGAQRLADALLTLPTHSMTTAEDLQRIQALFRSE